MSNDEPMMAGEGSAAAPKKKPSSRKRKEGRKTMKKKRKVKKTKTRASVKRQRKSYEIISGRPAARYPKFRKGTVPAAIWAALKSKKRATTLQIAEAIRGKVKSRSAKNLADLTGHVGWYFYQWKKLGVLRVVRT